VHAVELAERYKAAAERKHKLWQEAEAAVMNLSRRLEKAQE